MNRAPFPQPTAYRGPWPILAHRTLADLAHDRPAIVIEGTFREVSPQSYVHGQPQHVQSVRVPSAKPREDLRIFQHRWDEGDAEHPDNAAPDNEAQFRESDLAAQNQPDQCPPIMALAIALGTIVAGAAMFLGVITAIAVLIAIVGGVR